MDVIFRHQDGCMQLAAKRSVVKGGRQNQFEQRLMTLSSHVSSPQQDHNWYGQNQLALETQLEKVRLERDAHVRQEKELTVHMYVLGCETLEWKMHVIFEAEHLLEYEAMRSTAWIHEIQKAMDKHYKTHWKEAELEIQDLQESNNAHSLALGENQQEHQDVHTECDIRLQLKAQTIRKKS